MGQNTNVCVIKQDCASKYKNVCYIYRGVGKQTQCVLYIQDCGSKYKVCVIKQDCVSKYKNVCFIYKSVGQNTIMCVIYTRLWVKIQKCV